MIRTNVNESRRPIFQAVTLHCNSAQRAASQAGIQIFLRAHIEPKRLRRIGTRQINQSSASRGVPTPGNLANQQEQALD